MARNTLQRLFPLVGSSSASKQSRLLSGDAASLQVKMPQSQPMQRSIDSQSIDSNDSDCSTSPPSEDELSFDSASTITSPKSPKQSWHIPPEGLHSPLKATDHALIRVAEMLSESICPLDDGWYFTPSPDEPHLLSYDYSDEQCTVLAIHSLVKRASLPVDTFILAALIIQRLKPEFYEEWCELLSEYQPLYDEERSREVVVVAAIIIAQKFLHDAIYTLTTWSDIVCEQRDDLHNENLHTTERLILEHICWRINLIADETTISDMVNAAHNEKSEAYERYSKYLPVYEDSPPDERDEY